MRGGIRVRLPRHRAAAGAVWRGRRLGATIELPRVREAAEAQPAVRDPHLFGVVHMFDAPSVNTLRMNEGHKMQYNYAAASDSYERVRAFLDKWVRGKLASE
jgi:hypothetical protein